MSFLQFLTFFILVFFLTRFIIVILNFITKPKLLTEKVNENFLVSILIPARNEQHNIINVLSLISKQTYSLIEIVVYNDMSSDETASVVKKFSEIDSRVRLVEGGDLPRGWLGKNYACYQLSKEAKGVFLIYLDADVIVSPSFVENALAYFQKHKLTLLSIFPRQILVSVGEKLVVPSMNWILLNLLFLRLVSWSKRSSLSAANGQMMMFNAHDYHTYQWHLQVKSSPVEDVDISRLVKKTNRKVATLLGSKDISCRMYSSYSASINGFSKNVFAFFGGSPCLTILFALLGTIAPFIVITTLSTIHCLLFFLFLITSRILVSILSEQSVLFNVLLWPVQQMAFIHLVINAIRVRISGSLVWKGRSLQY